MLSFGEAEEAPEGAETEKEKEKARVKRKGLTRQDRKSKPKTPFMWQISDGVVVEDEPVGESSKRSETFVDVAPSLKDLGKDKEKKEKVSLKCTHVVHLADWLRKR